MRTCAPWKVPWDHTLGSIYTFLNFKQLFQKLQRGGCMLYACGSCIFLFLNFPLFFWPSSCIWPFHSWRKKNWKFTFHSEKGQNITACQKAENEPENECSSSPLLWCLYPQPYPAALRFEPLGASQSIQYIFERFAFIPFTFHEEKALDKQREEP